MNYFLFSLIMHDRIDGPIVLLWLAPQLSLSQLSLSQPMPWISVSLVDSVALVPPILLYRIWTRHAISKSNKWRWMLLPSPSTLELESLSLMALRCPKWEEIWGMSTSCMLSLSDSSARSYSWHLDCSCSSWILSSLQLTLPFNSLKEHLSHAEFTSLGLLSKT